MSATLKKGMINGDSVAVPDSTTRERVMFSHGEEVLVNLKDQFFLGFVVEIDLEGEKCLVKFCDNTEKWSSFKSLKRLRPESCVKCVVCKESHNKTDNEVIVCNKCLRGYHQLCHQPVIKHGRADWLCKHCDEDKSWTKKTDIVDEQPSLPPLPTSVAKLPYKLESLVWDVQHQTNTAGKYCYCGGEGEWFLKMLQCGRCKQWFHERCIRALVYPLYVGDRFYIFVCAACNNGVEFVRRIEMWWADLTHLTLFNLTAYQSRKYHDLDSHIVNYIKFHQPALQLPPKISSCSQEDIKKNVLNALLTDRKRFKGGSEIKKGKDFWGLRVRVPPPGPVFTLPPHPLPITDLTLEARFRDKRFKFFPLPSTPFPKSSKVYAECNSLPPPSGLKLIYINNRPLVLPKGVPAIGHKVCIKSSVPCYPEPAKIERRIREQELGSLRLREYRFRKSRKILQNPDNEESAVEHITPPTPPPSEDTPQPTPPSNSPAPGATPSSAPASVASQILAVDGNPALNGRAERLRPITLPLPLTPVITQPLQRPMKRRLSEKDIRINRNGEVKRRRLRRQCTTSPVKQPVTVAQLSIPNPISSNANSFPTTSVPSNNVKPHSSSSLSAPNSCQSISPMSSHDLKSSVHSYFGAANRISCGEKFKVLAKRTLMDGRVQYLIQWNNKPLI